MMFRKWLSIENHYQTKFIERFKMYNPDLIDDTFIVTEKIDGANFSITFHADGHRSYAKRKHELTEDASFFNFQSIMEDEKFYEWLDLMGESCEKDNRTLQFVGELFASGINGRVYYGDQKQWRWYAIYEHFEDEEVKLMSAKHSWETACHYDICSVFGDIRYFVPVYFYNERIPGLDFEANIDLRIRSFLTPYGYDKFNLLEGMVIRPFHADYSAPDGATFFIKYKNPEFMDNNNKAPKEKKVVSEEVTNIVSTLTDMIGENRSLDLFSKHGEIETQQQIGAYIMLYYADIVEDFEKDTMTILKNHNESKYINKFLSKEIAMELKKYL